MNTRNAELENGTPAQNPFKIQLDDPMAQIAAPGVCEMKPYSGEDSRFMSAFPGG